LAATLVTQGFQLLDLVWRPEPKIAGGYACYFIFAWAEELDEKEVLFRGEKLRVEPKTFGRAHRDLKRRMAATRQEQLLRAAG
jgi:hypothetical protein